MMPFRSTKFLLTLSIALAAGALITYTLLWFFFVGEQRNVAARASTLSNAEQVRAGDASLKTLLSETAPKRGRADALFVGANGAVGFLKELEQVGIFAGVKTTVVKVAKKEGEETTLAEAGLETITVAIESEGSFAGVHRFLALIERLPRPITFSRVSFSQGEKGIWNGVFELEALKIK